MRLRPLLPACLCMASLSRAICAKPAVLLFLVVVVVLVVTMMKQHS